jgi:2-C-methyl-D-erythritol 4-phosphate cytidylyltransferase
LKKFAVIVAGGSGLRMGTEVPKQFLLLNGKSILQYTIEAFLKAYDDMNVIVVLPPQHLQLGEETIAKINNAANVQVTAGGDTRFQSVKNGLAKITEPSIIFVHDGVRCMISKSLIHRCYEQALAKGSAIPCVAATDSIRLSSGDHHEVIDRTTVRIIQTPQTFLSSILLPAFQQEYQSSFTDEATVVEAMGEKVYLVEGDYNNIKITRPVDLYIAEKLLHDHLTLKPS